MLKCHVAADQGNGNAYCRFLPLHPLSQSSPVQSHPRLRDSSPAGAFPPSLLQSSDILPLSLLPYSPAMVGMLWEPAGQSYQRRQQARGVDWCLAQLLPEKLPPVAVGKIYRDPQPDNIQTARDSRTLGPSRDFSIKSLPCETLQEKMQKEYKRQTEQRTSGKQVLLNTAGHTYEVIQTGVACKGFAQLCTRGGPVAERSGYKPQPDLEVISNR